MSGFPFRPVRVAAAAVGLAAALVMVGGGVSAAGDPGGRPLTAVLTGAAEVNGQGVPNQGDPDGSGTARITVNPGLNVVCWNIEVANIATATRGHIHQAPAGVNGPIVVEFFEVGEGQILQGCTTPTGTTARAILENPAGFYVNLHNPDFPAGAVRGQLTR